jgi:hypothetical protein
MAQSRRLWYIDFAMRFATILTAVALLAAAAAPQWQADEPPPGTLVVAKLKYGGGGDWYVNPTSLPNLHAALREAGLPAARLDDDVVADISSPDAVFKYPILFMTGHGEVRFSDEELARLRAYLERGGFLHVDDNYGLDQSWRRECARLFPDDPLVELPPDHEIYRAPYDFPGGLPKIHEHHGGPARAYAVFRDGRMVIFYSYNTDLGDGWEDADVHDDPPAKREAALKMGVNVVVYALTH